MRRHPSTLPASLKTISRRIELLEAIHLPASESAEDRRLRENLEAGLRRVAEWRARGELPPYEPETGPFAEARRQELLRAALAIRKHERARQMKHGRR